MSGYTCVQVRDAAPELALGVLDGAARAEVVEHLRNCSRCQAYVAELTEAADVLPLMTSEREPPAGFEHRVLASVHAEQRRSRRRWVMSIAAVAAAATIFSITAVRVIGAGNDASPAATGPPATTSQVATAQARMISETDGTTAGWAYVSQQRSVMLSIAYGVTPGRYNIQVRSGTDAPVLIGGVDISAPMASWTGTSNVPIVDGDTISLVAADGAPVCHGTVTTAQ
jgi:hypothetical protein